LDCLRAIALGKPVYANINVLVGQSGDTQPFLQPRDRVLTEFALTVIYDNQKKVSLSAQLQQAKLGGFGPQFIPNPRVRGILNDAAGLLVLGMTKAICHAVLSCNIAVLETGDIG
jgi:hypothetical protein